MSEATGVFGIPQRNESETITIGRYRNWFGRKSRRHCPHVLLEGIYGDEINMVGDYRLYCLDCGAYIDGPVEIAIIRRSREWNIQL